MPLRVGSRWCDTEGHEFIVDAVDQTGDQTWVTYYRRETNTYYRCLSEAFAYRFREIIQ